MLHTVIAQKVVKKTQRNVCLQQKRQDSKKALQVNLPVAKKRRMELSKKECENLPFLLEGMLLRREMYKYEQFITELSNTLCNGEQFLLEIISTHHYCFSSLCEQYQKGLEPFLS